MSDTCFLFNCQAFGLVSGFPNPVLCCVISHTNVKFPSSKVGDRCIAKLGELCYSLDYE